MGENSKAAILIALLSFTAIAMLMFMASNIVDEIAAEQNEQYQEQLEAVSEEIGVEPKNILPLETKYEDTKRFKTDSAEYLIKFDENNQIRAIVKDSE